MKKFLRKHLEIFIVTGLILLFLIFYLWDSIVVTVYPGHAGVKFRRLFNKGTVTDTYFGEGIHFLLPWNKMYIYDVRIQELKQSVAVLSQNGLTITVLISVRYYLLKDEVPLLHQRVGENYKEKVIIPSTISSVREVIGKYLPEELYTTARHVIQDEILVEAVEETGRLPIIYADMIIELIKLPDMINTAIETKLKHQQEFLEYQYRLLKADEEKKRLAIEASGIQQYQNIISQSLSEQLLTWQGIQATKELAASQNSKLIIIGGKNGLPVILNTGDSSRFPLTEAAEATEPPTAPAESGKPEAMDESSFLPGKASAEPGTGPVPEAAPLPDSVSGTQTPAGRNRFLEAIETVNRKLSPDLPAYRQQGFARD